LPGGPAFLNQKKMSKKKEMVEMTIVYCDWCKEKICDDSYVSVRKADGTELDFHQNKCIDLYTKPKQR